jgi:WhiB family redox-sensing transcriptional regulator
VRSGPPRLRARGLGGLNAEVSLRRPVRADSQQAIDWSWMEQAACRGDQPGAHNPAFFSESPTATSQALAICARCPVQAACREFAIRTGQEFGVWGGLDETELRRLTKEAHGGVPVRRVGHRVTRTDTNARANQTHCKHGHPFDEANTRIRTNGARQCRACARLAVLQHRERLGRRTS